MTMQQIAIKEMFISGGKKGNEFAFLQLRKFKLLCAFTELDEIELGEEPLNRKFSS